MKEYTRDEFRDALKKIGLVRGDTALVATELFTLGRMTGARDTGEYCEMILDGIFDVIGRDEGTVVVHTYTTYTGRYGLPYDHDRSRPITGVFGEYVLFHPDSVRSLHPINSVAAIGKRKEEICLNVSASNYGMDSPPDRLYKLGCQTLRLGIAYETNVFLHYIEALYGLPYQYNKILDIETIVDGRKTDRQFFASVFHLELTLEYDLDPLKKALLEKGCVHSAPVGGGMVHRVPARDYCDVLLAMVKRDPYCMLKRTPNFVKGVKPYDGITRGRDGMPEIPEGFLKNLMGEKRGKK